MSSLDLIDKADYPTSFDSLVDFQKAIMDAVAHDDQGLLDYLFQDFRVCEHGVFFVGTTQHNCRKHNQHWAQRRI